MTPNDTSHTYVTFRLGRERFAIGIHNIREVVEYDPETTRIPRTQPAVRGVMNLRGNVLPVIDLNQKLRDVPTELSRDTCVLVVEVGEDDERRAMGAMADAVEEVVVIAQEDLLPPPRGGTRYEPGLLQNLGRQASGFVLVLDLDAALGLAAPSEPRPEAVAQLP